MKKRKLELMLKRRQNWSASSVRKPPRPSEKRKQRPLRSNERRRRSSR